MRARQQKRKNTELLVAIENKILDLFNTPYFPTLPPRRHLWTTDIAYYLFPTSKHIISESRYTKPSFSCSIHSKNASRSDLDRLENLFLTDSIGCNFFLGTCCGQASFSLILFCITLS